ncbi:polysaccharide deacetylase family protein [Paenibacillus sp. KN14-4R]|uniref:polysaccharide deacetylase family protein n=1 Tax=Paenibacillus sp. KN14-4R TaxID=3445773 RepID=UPI003FA0A34A
MITVHFSNHFVPERSYVIHYLMEYMLGIPYQIHIEPHASNQVVCFRLENGRQLLIKDSFFSQFVDGLSYLKCDPFQIRPFYATSAFAPELDIPIIFGDNEWTEDGNDLTIGMDLISSIFFMLSRWEEVARRERDEHNRFPHEASLAYRNGFLHRPVVNEYVELLWNLFSYLGIGRARKERKYELVITHDIDDIYYWGRKGGLFRAIGGDLLIRKSISLALKKIPEYWNVRQGKEKDPFDTFDWLMDLSESMNTRSRFYFMSGGVTKYDRRYDVFEKKCLDIFTRIRERDHIIGFHPSYDASHDLKLFRSEKERLEKACGIEVTEGRQHYLRFDPERTWEIWDKAGMKVDSTLSYAEHEGFRCGTCDSYPVFHVLERRKMEIEELPLLAMEATMIVYQKLDPAQVFNRVQALMDTVRRYNGKFVLLWHNANLEGHYWQPFKNIYQKIVQYGGSSNAYLHDIRQ